jgi:hypothetical protein
MKGGVSIAVQVLFIVYVFFTFPEGDQNQISFGELYRQYAFLLTGAILVYALEYFLKEGPKGLLHANVLIVNSVVYWLLLDLLQGRYELDIVSVPAVKTAFISISLFVIVVQIFVNFSINLPDIVDRASRISIPSGVVFGTVIFCFSVAFFHYYRASYFDFDHMMRGLTKSRWASPWARGASGGTDAIIEHFKYFGYVLPPLTALLFLQNKVFDLRNYLALGLTVFFSAFEFQGGGRRITGFLAGSLIMTVLIYKREKLKLIHFIMVAVSGFGLLVLLDMQLAFRNRGYQGMFEEYQLTQLDEVRVDDNFLRLCQIIDRIPSEFPHSGFQYPLWAFSRPIPRAFWPGKPLGPGFDVAQMVGALGVSLTSTIIGESYASQGFFMIILMGALFGILSGSLTKMLDGNLGVLGVALYSIGALALVGGIRSLPDLIIFSYGFLGILAIYRQVLSKSYG